jgi:hypothetical protein
MPRNVTLAPAFVILFAALAGLACSTPIVSQLTSSGAMGIVTVTVAGKKEQKIYLPQITLDSNNRPTLAVLDATFNTSGNAVFDTIELTGHVDGSLASAVAASPTAVVVVGVNSPYVDFIDPTADVVTATVQLPANILTPDGGPATFSGSSTLIQGAVIDTANNRAIIATAGGFLPVDLTSHAFSALVRSVPSENFGFWPSKEWVLAPFYLCSTCAAQGGAPSGFQIVDMTAGQVYLQGSGDGGSLVGVQPASVDIDPLTNIAVIPDQNAGNIYTLNLSVAQLAASGGTFTAPVGQAPASLTSGLYSGVAIDQVNHQAFLEAANGIGVAIVQLPDALSDGGVNPTKAATASMPNPPSGSSWTNSGDPHGVAVAVGLASGNPEGFVANQDNSEVARIDLDSFAGAGPGPIAAATFEPLVTFIPAAN